MLKYSVIIPKLSIIVPTYNNLENLRECISSIQKQTFINYEVWIIDGGSKDGTIPLLEKLKAPFYWVSEKDNGIYDAMNKGIHLSKGEWIYFLGADDQIYDKETLKAIFRKTKNSFFGIITGKIEYKISDTHPFIYSKKKRIKAPSWSWTIWIRNSLHHQGTIFKREIFDRLKYNINHEVLADYELNIKLYKMKVKNHICSESFALCSSDGISKKGLWNIYKEEINLKTGASYIALFPVFFAIAFVKFLLRKRIDYCTKNRIF